MTTLILPNRLISKLSRASKTFLQTLIELDEFAWHPLWLPPYCQRYKNLINKKRMEA